MRRLPWLDWVRFTAALMVVVSHARGSTWVAWNALPESSQTTYAKIFYTLTRAGLEWVVVFFVISGFLVGGGAIRKVSDRSFQAGQFALDRITRIWVPLVPALLLTSLIAIARGATFSLGDFVGNLLGLQGVLSSNFGGNEPLWSLSYEIWFYVLTGALASLFNSGPRGRPWALFFFATAVCVFLKLSPWLLGCWLIGVCCSFGNVAKLHSIGSLPWLAVFLIGAGISQLCSETHAGFFTIGAEATFGRNAALLLESVGAGLFIATITRRRIDNPNIASVELAGRRFAAISYTLYLTHYPMLLLWEQFGPGRSTVLSMNTVLLFAVKIMSCLLVALLLYLPFEAQTSSVRKRLRKSLGFTTDE